MRNRNILSLALFLVTALSSGCAGLPFLSFVGTAGTAAGSAYEGYVVWNSGEATKYYAFDLDTTYRAVEQASGQLKLEATVIKSEGQKGYTLETKGNVPMRIDILPLKRDVTSVIVKISIFGDKNYVELFYRLIDEHLPKEPSVATEKIR